MIKKFLLVGLGNPNKQYKKTRHNIGHHFLNYLKEQWQTSNWKKNQKCLAELSFLDKKSQKIILAKTLVFMNNSGMSVNNIKKFFNISLKNIYVVQDDTDINLGSFKISYNRGSAGHKGIESIINHLKSKNFYRIRIGIRSPSQQREKAEELVLKNFTPRENKVLKQVFSIIEKELEKICFCENKRDNK